MTQIKKVIDAILKWASIVLLAVTSVLVVWQVFTRYVLQNPSSWSEELVSYMFAWMALLGASIVVGERGHMNIPVVVERMGKGAQMFFSIFSEVVACVFAAVILVFGGVQITTLAMGQMTSSLGVPIGIFYVVLPLSGVLNVVYTIINIYDIVKGNIDVLPGGEEQPEEGKEA